jgi:TonB family protein
MKIATLAVLAVLLAVGTPAQQAPDGKPVGGIASTPNHASAKVDVEILTDTKGVDFGPYLANVLSQLRVKWYGLIPDAARSSKLKPGKSAIQFVISRNGTIDDIKVISSAGDESLDKMAVEAVKSAAPFPDLSSTFEGSSVAVRGTFTYNPLLSFMSILSPGDLTQQATRAVAAHPSGTYGPDPSIPPRSAESIPPGVEVLSDTQGVDFSKYIYSAFNAVRGHWYVLIPNAAKAPAMKSGVTKVEFAILRDGSILGIKIVQSSGDGSLDQAAWGAIAARGNFVELPLTFKGQVLRLRFTFQYNPQKAVTIPSTLGNPEVLTDTQGVDFGPYLSKVMEAVHRSWYILIPRQTRPPLMKSGEVAIEFRILPDGKVAGMKLVGPSGDVVLDRAAWGSITASVPFAYLPAEFTGPYLALRIRFFYNPMEGQIDSNDQNQTPTH